MNGKMIELDKLIMRNETTVAVGNMKVNARGDELGPGGRIVKRAEEEYAEREDSVPTQVPRPIPVQQPVATESAQPKPVEKSIKLQPKPVKSDDISGE